MSFFDDKAYTINDIIQAVIAIEDELGSLPAGVYASVRTRLDILEARINNPLAPAPNVNNPFFIGGSPTSGVSIQAGFGDPNLGHIQAIPGSIYLREDGYNIQGLYSLRTDGYWHMVPTDPPGISRVVTPTVTTSTYNIDPFTDDFIPVNTSTNNITVNLPFPTNLLGKGYTIADITGNASSKNITIQGNGYLINGSSSIVISNNYQALSVVWNGSFWTKL